MADRQNQNHAAADNKPSQSGKLGGIDTQREDWPSDREDERTPQRGPGTSGTEDDKPRRPGVGHKIRAMPEVDEVGDAHEDDDDEDVDNNIKVK